VFSDAPRPSRESVVRPGQRPNSDSVHSHARGLMVVQVSDTVIPHIRLSSECRDVTRAQADASAGRPAGWSIPTTGAPGTPDATAEAQRIKGGKREAHSRGLRTRSPGSPCRIRIFPTRQKRIFSSRAVMNDMQADRAFDKPDPDSWQRDSSQIRRRLVLAAFTAPITDRRFVWLLGATRQVTIMHISISSAREGPQSKLLFVA
jgi:hypothetical protein